jgi:hypothetical protein
MKYLKIFDRFVTSNDEIEEDDNLKFKVGDYVRIISPSERFGKPYDDMYIINSIATIDKEYYLHDLEGKGYSWIKEDRLDEVPEDEVAAIKYNL